MTQKAELEMTGSVSGAKLTLTNPETGEGVVLSIDPSMVAQVEEVFYNNE